MTHDYKWEAKQENDNPKITGVPDSTKFNRHEGYEMLYLVNTLMKNWDLKKESSAIKMERMIREKMPSNVVSQTEVKKWIQDHWTSYDDDLKSVK